MPLTNADYLANPEPASADLVAHFMSLGASRARAEHLAKFIRMCRFRARLFKPAALIGVVFAAWIAYALSLAFRGSPSTPGFEQMLWPSVGALAVGIVIAISRAVALTTGSFWEASDSIPRELASAPRRVVVRRIASGGIFIAVGFALAVATAGLMVRDVRDAAWLQREGVETNGTVISRDVHNGKSKGYFVTYRYTAGGVVMQNTQQVGRREYERMAEGATIPVTYYATQPMISKPRSRAAIGSPARFLAPLAGIAAGMLLIAPFLALVMWYAAKEQEAMATRGVAVLARVTKVHGNAVRYSYDTNQGVIDARIGFGKQRPAPMPAAGETYVVLYDPDNPRRSMPLAMLQDVRFV